MPSLYVANCSKAEFFFTYMLPENMRPFSQHIRAGTQIEIKGDQASLDAIISQHSIYGMQPSDKVTRKFGGLAYRLNKPISIDAIQQGLTQMEQEEIERALEARKITTVVQDQMYASKAQEIGSKQTSPLEIEIVEEAKGPTDSAPKFNQTITVEREGMRTSPKRGRPRKN